MHPYKVLFLACLPALGALACGGTVVTTASSSSSSSSSTSSGAGGSSSSGSSGSTSSSGAPMTTCQALEVVELQCCTKAQDPSVAKACHDGVISAFASSPPDSACQAALNAFKCTL